MRTGREFQGEEQKRGGGTDSIGGGITGSIGVLGGGRGVSVGGSVRGDLIMIKVSCTNQSVVTIPDTCMKIIVTAI